MYKCAKTLMYLTLFVIISTLLSACGGAPTEDTSSQPNNIANNTETRSSTSTSSEASSSRSTSQSSQVSIGINTTPSTSIQLQLFQLSENSITLVWNDATTEAGISHYKISRNGKLIARVDYPSYMLLDQGLAPYTNYDYTITAFDLTGNESSSSPIFTLRTLAASGGITSTSNLNTQTANNIPSLNIKSSAGSKSNSSLPSVSSKSSASSKSNSSLSSVSSISSSRSSSASSESSTSSVAAQTVTISWNHPTRRENGTFLELDEIGGYEIRYRKPTGTSYTYITLNGNLITEHTFPDKMQKQDLEFEIAVFDTAGLYSQFVKIAQ